MLDYDAEAASYDRTRGGEARAGAAAEAVRGLLPDRARTVLDVACGTGIVSTLLREPGRVVVGVDISAGMLAYARPRLGGAVVRGDATRLPIADAAVDAVLFMWLLHLVDAEVGEQAMAEAARVLRPGGVVVATVDKNFAMYRVPSDLSAVLEPVHRAHAVERPDAPTVFAGFGRRLGLEPLGENAYVGHGQAGRRSRCSDCCRASPGTRDWMPPRPKPSGLAWPPSPTRIVPVPTRCTGLLACVSPAEV